MLFLLLASPWFLLVDFAFLALIVLLTEREMGTAAGAVLVIALAAFFFFAGVNPLTWLIPNFGTVVIAALVYLGIGIGWAALKWFFYTYKDETQDVIRGLHKNYLKDKSTHDKNEDRTLAIDPSYKIEDYITFDAWLTANQHANPLNPMKNKVRITRWMIWWPTSIIWTVLSDLLINIYNFIYDKIAFVFKSILDGQIKRALKDV